ncbi:MAG: hypothetical protein KJ060_04810, partial [Candidatus Hydrogenedentes bacterium]|nr:hypothetical protein [Candidatus Hydrogenedentota bacterium]
ALALVTLQASLQYRRIEGLRFCTAFCPGRPGSSWGSEAFGGAGDLVNMSASVDSMRMRVWSGSNACQPEKTSIFTQ